jgi:hypothetical protein
MTNFANQSLAILGAIFNTLVSMGSAITVPPAQATVVALPLLV